MFERTRPGRPLRITAAAWNACLDAAEAHASIGLAPSPAPRARTAGREASIVAVKNASGADRDRFDVLGIDSVVFDPADNPDAWAAGPVLSCIVPDIAEHHGRFVILIEPIASGVIGRGLVAGTCVVPLLVDNEDTEHHGAEIIDAVVLSLKAVHGGSAAVLWREGGTGLQWAVVRLGVARQPAVFHVDLTQVGGTQGTPWQPATWTYDVDDAATGEVLAAAVNPVSAPHLWRRPDAGYMTAATAGYAHWADAGDGSEELVIGWTNEQIEQESCE